MKDNRGLSTIETLLTFPIMISIFWAFIQFGSFMFVLGKVQDAKRVGLDEMEKYGGVNQYVVSKIKEEFSDTSIDLSSLVIDGTPAPQQYDTELSLKIKLDFPISLIIPYETPTFKTLEIELEDSVSSEYIIR